MGCAEDLAGKLHVNYIRKSLTCHDLNFDAEEFVRLPTATAEITEGPQHLDLQDYIL